MGGGVEGKALVPSFLSLTSLSLSLSPHPTQTDQVGCDPPGWRRRFWTRAQTWRRGVPRRETRPYTLRREPARFRSTIRPGGNPGANLKSISHRCYLREVAFEWESTKTSIHLLLACPQGGVRHSNTRVVHHPGDNMRENASSQKWTPP